MEVQVSKGFVVLAQNTEHVNYVKQAYALALSIKQSQKLHNKISLLTNDDVPEEYKHAFDQIIEIPWGDLAKNPLWKIENRWKFYHVSPYDETIVLDTDMLVLDDLLSWWDYCKNSDLKFCSKIRNYKGEVIEVDTYHRKAFIENKLSNPYVAVHYFKKSDLAHDFYKVLEFVMKNWDVCNKKFAPKNIQKWLSVDLATAIAIDIMGIEDQVIDKICPLEFVHMKPAIQGWPKIPSTWKDIVNVSFNGSELTVGNFKQHYVFHYVDKEFVNDVIINKLKDSLSV